jgi:hypothetical protein
MKYSHSAACYSIAGLHATPKETVMSHHVEGPFDVKTSPLAADEITTGTTLRRYGLDKLYHGPLDATAKGEMLGSGSPATGAAGYVAIEEVTGTLEGRKGSFALQHWGTMGSGNFELRVEIVPGSGTGELQGIAGTLTITNNAGKHSYALDYTLPEAQ